MTSDYIIIRKNKFNNWMLVIKDYKNANKENKYSVEIVDLKISNEDTATGSLSLFRGDYTDSDKYYERIAKGIVGAITTNRRLY